MEQILNRTQLQESGLQRLRLREDPESVARDLRQQGLAEMELWSLFDDAARQQRRGGLLRILAGVTLSLITLFIVTTASAAGVKLYGPGLLIGLFVLVNGILKLKSSGEIARAAKSNDPKPLKGGTDDVRAH
jgi:hypothetical protein